MSRRQNFQDGPSDYRERYSLHCAPFEKSADDRFFYAGNALMQRLDLLSHLTQFGDSVVVVSGPEGSGKSTLLRRFLAQASPQWKICTLVGGEFEHFEQRLNAILGGVDGASAVESLSQWAAGSDASQLLVVVIDEAERLEEQALNQISELLDSAYGSQIRLILFGTAQVNDLVRRAQERQALERNTQLLEMPRFSEEETASYLMYRLAVAGYSGESPFTATEVRGICKAADGRPAGINELAHEALLEHNARASSKGARPAPGKPAFLAWPMVLVSTGVLVLIAYLSWEYLEPQAPSQHVPDIAQAPTEEVPLQLPAAPPPLVKPSREPEIQASPATPAPLPEPPLGSEATQTAPEIPVPGEAPEVSPATAAPLPELTQGSAATQTAPEIPVSGEAPEASPASADATPADESQTGVAAPEKELQQPAAPGTVAAPPPQAAPPREVTRPQPYTGTVQEKPTLPHREAWLLEQPASSYSLQLLGSRSEKSVARFIERHRLDLEQTAYYRATYKGADWYVLLYGRYPDRQAALDARAGLPEQVRRAKPWPRDMKAVHRAIRENR